MSQISQQDVDAVFPKVAGTIADALGCDAEEVKRDASLIDDLGAESIDFLDIQFKLEQAFGFKIAQGEMFPDDLMKNPDIVKEGKLTPDGLSLVKTRLPHVDFSQFEKDPQISRLGALFTVGAVVSFVERKLAKAA